MATGPVREDWGDHHLTYLLWPWKIFLQSKGGRSENWFSPGNWARDHNFHWVVALSLLIIQSWIPLTIQIEKYSYWLPIYLAVRKAMFHSSLNVRHPGLPFQFFWSIQSLHSSCSWQLRAAIWPTLCLLFPFISTALREPSSVTAPAMVSQPMEDSHYRASWCGYCSYQHMAHHAGDAEFSWPPAEHNLVVGFPASIACSTSCPHLWAFWYLFFSKHCMVSGFSILLTGFFLVFKQPF